MPEESQHVKKRIEQDFSYHPLKEGQVERYQQLRDAYNNLANVIAELTPSSRHQSTALTLLHQSNLMANAAIACNE